MWPYFSWSSNRKERVDAFFHGFADADQNSSGERDGELPRFFDGAETQRGHFVWGFGVRQTIAHQARADVFQHQADAGVRIFQTHQGGAVHDAGIGVREQAGFFQYEFAHRCEIVDRARKTLITQELAGLGKDPFGLIAETEESFLAAGLAATFGEREHFLRRHEVSARLARVLTEGAVAAIVAAKGGERDENFFREGDDSSLPTGANFGGSAQ